VNAVELRPFVTLGSVSTFSTEAWDQSTLFDREFPYLEISSIDLITGEIGTLDSVPVELAASRARMIIRPNDLLVSMTRPSRGAIAKAGFDTPDPFIASTGFGVVRRVDEARITRDYLFLVLRSRIGLQQMEQRSSGGNYPAITGTELRRIKLPLPPLREQERLVAKYSAAIAQLNKSREKAAALLASIDDYLLSELGIALPPETENTLVNRTFRVSAHELGGWRFDPHALHPDVEACREAIERLPNSAHLRQVVSFSRDQVAGRQEPLPYVGLEHVQGGTGILLDVEYEEDFGSALMFEPGHVLFPKLRPYLNKVHLADTTGYCSTEFHVLQAKAVSPEFLTLVLRSEITVRQTKHLMTGNTLPRLQTRDIERLPIPIPDKDIQDRIVTYAAKTQSEAVKLTQSAITELESAKREIEAILLEPPKQLHQPQNSFALG
jgi:hypothetical protein